jgi:hypothetical protein
MLTSKLCKTDCQAQVFSWEDVFSFLHKAPLPLDSVYGIWDYLTNLHKNTQYLSQMVHGVQDGTA